MTAWLAVALDRLSRGVSGGRALVLSCLLLGCGPSLSGEEPTPDTLGRSSAALARDCPQIPVNSDASQGDGTQLQYPCDSFYCGDGICRGGENMYNCPDDCGYPAYCGDGVCSYAYGENDGSCPSDCYCGDNVCNGSENINSCPRDCGCPNQCGNGVCNNNESTVTCAPDCGSLCGDGACNGGEHGGNCPQDCNYCGDGVCQYPETRYNCPNDCGSTWPCYSSTVSADARQCELEPAL